jgi:hypothetical protein
MTGALLGLWLASALQEEELSFRRDVRPVLSEYCFACHGPDAQHRDSDLRLDSREGALSVLDLRDPGKSELLRRIEARDRGDRMPPVKTGKIVPEASREVLRRWIRAGAPWESHWAFERPRRVEPPGPPAENPIDRFIEEELRKRGLEPAGEASRETLVRRASLDLLGLPPDPEEVDAFLGDRAPGAYERLLDRLLASPRYGERMALEWLDAARYADTHGLHVDSHRDMWPWRDWVIRAFNENLPFDRFTIEQIAGDLLPDAGPSQLTASGFNRNHMISYQGSSIPEQVRVSYVVDRVNTLGTVWLGLTLSCAQCHDHKFDPLTQADYYGLFAFFNQVAEKPLDGQLGNAAPLLVLDPEAAKRYEAIAKDRKGEPELRKLLAATPNVMVMRDAEKPRRTFILKRGDYDRHGSPVEAATPLRLPPMPDGAPRNRLGLARWLVDPANPLTARVTVNRLWQMLFGTGIVETAEDFGAQGSWPSHPELLDRLAVDFVESGWDVKRMLRRMMTSRAYRRSSDVPVRQAGADPANRLLARGPRFRMPAELIRDQALAVSGLLAGRIGGPSVSPYQPAGVWEAVAAQDGKYSAQKYVQGRGEDLWRRSLYTFWKRLAPPPSLAAFDAPSRESCTVRRQRTNTPLQALVTLNDPQFVEAARVLAERTAGEADRLGSLFRRVLARFPSEAERAILEGLRGSAQASYEADPGSAERLCGVGEAPRGTRPAAETAAWTLVASAVLNLDEALTKE